LSPFEGKSFKSRISHTIINGNLIYENTSFLNETRGKRLTFER